jgi:hypothetical protein
MKQMIFRASRRTQDLPVDADHVAYPLREGSDVMIWIIRGIVAAALLLASGKAK